MTRKDYDIFQAPTGDALFGRVVNYFGFERGAKGASTALRAGVSTFPPIGFDKARPLINQQVDMKGREQITECLLTGVKVRATNQQMVIQRVQVSTSIRQLQLHRFSSGP